MYKNNWHVDSPTVFKRSYSSIIAGGVGFAFVLTISIILYLGIIGLDGDDLVLVILGLILFSLPLVPPIVGLCFALTQPSKITLMPDGSMIVGKNKVISNFDRVIITAYEQKGCLQWLFIILIGIIPGLFIILIGIIPWLFIIWMGIISGCIFYLSLGNYKIVFSCDGKKYILRYAGFWNKKELSRARSLRIDRHSFNQNIDHMNE